MHWTADMPRRTALGLPVVPDVKILRRKAQNGRVMQESILSMTPGDKFPKRCGWAAGGSGIEVALCLEFQWRKLQSKLRNVTQTSPSDP